MLLHPRFVDPESIDSNISIEVRAKEIKGNFLVQPHLNGGGTEGKLSY